MKIGLIGYGKMGKAIESIAIERGHTIVFTVNSQHPIETADLSVADIAIEFSQPDLALRHMEACIENELPVVVGTTAWQQHLERVSALVDQKKGALLYASNFSVGVNILFQINEQLARLMSRQPVYTASIEEIHHVRKLDAPSGTAVTIAEGIINEHAGYDRWICGEGSAPKTQQNELGILALREPEVPGTHLVKYTSEIDTITLTHEAHSRKGFAQGAVIAAEFLQGRRGLFTMRDVLAL
jgi:4-hydroxy-tetrahydrodipicolinate reductase